MVANAPFDLEHHSKSTRRDEFLNAMDARVPWASLFAEISQHHPKAGNGRRPIATQHMLRTYFILHAFNPAYQAGAFLPLDGSLT